MNAPDPLAASYTEARTRWLGAAHRCAATVTTYDHPGRGPAGEPLAIDVATVGPGDADQMVVVVSGTHGVEGYCGSALQAHWLDNAAGSRPDDVAVVMVHAFNPHGFAWVRRVNEDNVDLNRNFVDWSAPPPRNTDYDTMADDLVPAAWDDDSRARTLVALARHLERLGPAGMQSAVSRGQYHHRTGVFYGGSGPTWSARWLASWAPGAIGQARRVAVVDLHTGLGPWGHGEMIVSEALSAPSSQRAAALWGEVHSTADGSSVSAQLVGEWIAALPAMLGHTEVTPAALEFGTVDQLQVLDALRADAWLHAYGDPTGHLGDQVRSQVRQAFCDEDPAWLGACWARFASVMDGAFSV